MSNIITLTSDYGLKDFYVGAMKAAMLEIAPNANLVDISHAIPPQDIMTGAWVVRNAAFLYPKNTVHLVVIDPTVGSDRNPIIVKINHQYFVGPDNGLFSLLIDEPVTEAIKITNPKYWRKDRSKTFDGRDLFGPVAAHLHQGVPMGEFGEPLEEIMEYHWAKPISDKSGIQGWVLHIDSFGNLITNISKELIDKTIPNKNVKIYVGTAILKRIVSTYSDEQDGNPVAYIGSSGMLEVAINKGNAAELLGISQGAQISIVVQK